MNRFSIKIAGASGQGVNVLGEILANAFKRAGYFVFAYREYPSLIKGGHATYQIDVSDNEILSSSTLVDIVMVLNKQNTQWHIEDLKQNGLIFHDIDNPRINSTEYAAIQQKNIKLLFVPALKLSQEVGGNDVTSNIVSVGTIWKVLGMNIDYLVEAVKRAFSDKPKFLEIDLKCAIKGYAYDLNEFPNYKTRLLKDAEISNGDKNKIHATSTNYPEEIFAIPIPDRALTESYLLTGNESFGLGAINAGVRAYYSYPMTPTSSLLTFFSENQDTTGMIVKQAEDEITAAAMTIGSMHMGTRSLTATSGGGFDLMTEHVSLAAMTEIPFVCIIGQRPGPATGMPSWTTQGDLMLAIFAGHGEFTRCVIAPKDAEDCFYSIQEAFNIAEKYQIPVMILTDKFLAESIYQISEFDENKIQIERGLVTDPEALKNLVTADRFKITDSGISPRWIPGSKAADFNANGDEHDENGNVTEDGEMAKAMIQKRLRKETTLLETLQSSEIETNSASSDARTIGIITWGSTYGVVKDTMSYLAEENIKVNHLNIKYLWPLKTGEIIEFINNHPDTVVIEGNHNSQLSQLIKMQTGLDIKHKLLKWDGRPFFLDEVINYIKTLVY